MSELDDVLDSVFAPLGPQGRNGQALPTPNVSANIADTRNALTRSAADLLGLPDAMRALRGELTEDEARHFAMTAALGAIPGSQAENMLMKGAGKLMSKVGGKIDPLLGQMEEALPGTIARVAKQGDVPGTPGGGPPVLGPYGSAATAYGKAYDPGYGLPSSPGKITAHLSPEASSVAQHLPSMSDPAIEKALAANPGASIFDIAGTHVGGPSESFKYTSMKSPLAEVYNDLGEFPREVPFSPSEKARALGFTTSAVHGTSVGLQHWDTPSGNVATGDALKLPEDELGVHFGSPRAAAEFGGNMLSPTRAPRVYPTVLQTGNALELPDLGTWHADKVVDALAKFSKRGGYMGVNNPDLIGSFPRHELDQLENIGDVRSYLQSKGYDSVKYVNNVEDKGHTSHILFKPSPHAPDFVAGARSPFAQFDPNKVSWPELAAGVGGVGLGTGLFFDEQGNPLVRTK